MSTHTFIASALLMRPVGMLGRAGLRVEVELTTQEQIEQAALAFLGQMGEPAFDAFMTKHFSGYLDSVREAQP